MLYNYFSGSIPYPNLNFGFHQTHPTNSNIMEDFINADVAEEQTNIDGDGDHDQSISRQGLSANDAEMTEGNASEAMGSPKESTLAHALNDYNNSASISEEQSQDAPTEAMQLDDRSAPAAISEATAMDVVNDEPSIDGAITSSPNRENQALVSASQSAFDPYAFQADMYQNGFLDESTFHDVQAHPDHEMAVSNSIDALNQPEHVSQDHLDGQSPHEAPISDLPTRPEPVVTAESSIPSDLSTYRVGLVPPFKGRSRSLSPPPPTKDNRYSVMANWPPPKPEFANRTDVYPPDNAPLHVWIQAYALRWGVWLAEIKDEAVREKVLAVVTDKMKAAWETAIREGYYLKPDPDAASDQEKEERDAQSKRGRKRAQSPSKLPAGFASEGKDKFAITNGELANQGLTFDMILKRVEAKDFDAGELRYDEVLQCMDRDVIIIKDWSTSVYGSILNRNLLMYCFWVVQEERNHWNRLNNLYNRFTKENQKKNTKVRMDGVQEREHQHMALATELTLLERPLADDQDEEETTPESVETMAVDAPGETADSAQQEAESSGQSDMESSLSKSQIVELAQSVHMATTEQALYQAFASRGLQAGDPTLGGLVADTQDEEKLKKILVEIFAHLEHTIKLARISRSQEQPADAIKVNQEMHMVQQKIGQLRWMLNQVLGSMSKLPSLPDSDVQKYMAGVNSSILHSQVIKPTAQDHDAQQAKIEESPKQEAQVFNSSENEIAGSVVTQPKLDQTQPSERQLTVSSTKAPTNQGIKNQQNQLKSLYATERWVPILNGMLAQRNMPPVSGTVNSWNSVKDVLQKQLGLDSHARNDVLQHFKTGYRAFLIEKGVPSLDQGSPVPSNRSAFSPAPSNASHASSPPPNWPTDGEILSAVPPQGIGAPELMQMFRGRVFTDRDRFVETLKRLTRFDQSTYRVYPKSQALPPATRQYNTLPPSLPSGQAPPVAMSPAPAPNKVVKLRIPQGNQGSTNSLPRQDESSFPSEYKSTEVNTSRNFSFRHLPHATLEQRQRMDEVIEQYISSTIKRRLKGRWGQYVSFKDPQNPDGPSIAHGFWDLTNKGERASGIDWFYTGQNMPSGWDVDGPDDQPQSQDQTQVQTPPSTDQNQPRLKLKVSKPVLNNDATKVRFPTPGTSPQQNFNAMPPPQQYNSYPGMSPNLNYNTSVYPGQAPPQAAMQYQQGFNSAQPTTINPALLMMKPDQSNIYQGHIQPQQAGTQQVQDQGGMKRGTKRAAPAPKAGPRKKKVRKTVVPDDDDEDEDYDPSQDY